MPIRPGSADDVRMLFIAGGLLVWFVVAVLAAVVVGRGIQLADQEDAAGAVLTTADLPAGIAPAA